MQERSLDTCIVTTMRSTIELQRLAKYHIVHFLTIFWLFFRHPSWVNLIGFKSLTPIEGQRGSIVFIALSVDHESNERDTFITTYF